MEKYFPPPPPEEPATNEELDKQIRSLMEDLVAGRGMDVSTAEEEALIRELMQDRLGQGLVEQRARMGRAGFGASGALAAMEGDIRRQAGQQATQETLTLRRQAEEDAIRNALEAVDVDIRSREEGRRAIFDQEFLNALKSSLGMDTGEGEGGEDNGGSAPLTSGWGEQPDLPTASGPKNRPENSSGGRLNPIPASAPPQGARLAGKNQRGESVYLVEQGNELVYYVVRA